MITKKEFDLISHGEVFATGVLPNTPEGLWMTDSGGELRWIAKKGWDNDWVIYCHWSYKSIQWIAQHGDKVHNESHIQKCVPNEIMNLYRH